MKALASQNSSASVTCGNTNVWINGNIIVDRDRFNQGRNYGISIAGGNVVFGVMDEFGTAMTICGTTDVLDDDWHHVAVQRRISDGQLWLFVDGSEEATATGPTGDISYPDDGVPENHCGGPCDNSDPYIVLAAEKHDAGAEFPSYSGHMDELRFSTILRYTSSSFSPPTAPFNNRCHHRSSVQFR